MRSLGYQYTRGKKGLSLTVSQVKCNFLTDVFRIAEKE
jgi:hypothetical protein